MSREDEDAGVGPGRMQSVTARTAPSEPTLGLRVLDAVTYAVGLTAVAVAVATPPGVVLWGGAAGVKFGLFLVGFVYFGYASLLLQPSRPTDDAAATRAVHPRDESDAEAGPAETTAATGPGRDSTRFERALAAVPPLDRYWIPPSARLSRGAKLMLASLSTLALSFGLEVLLGVGTPG